MEAIAAVFAMHLFLSIECSSWDPNREPAPTIKYLFCCQIHCHILCIPLIRCKDSGVAINGQILGDAGLILNLYSRKPYNTYGSAMSSCVT